MGLSLACKTFNILILKGNLSMLAQNLIIEQLQSQLPPEFEVGAAKSLLSGHYKAPLKILSALEKSGQLIRIKRGLYAFRQNLDRLALAGSLYGPSYVSFETALSFYEFIPERVEVVMSVVDGSPIKFDTPVGQYLYFSQSRALFALGMGMMTRGERSFLIATKEKALLDTVSRAQLKAKNLTDQEVLEFVTEGLRVDIELLKSLSTKKMNEMANLYRNFAPRKLVAAIKNLKGVSR